MYPTLSTYLVEGPIYYRVKESTVVSTVWPRIK